MSQRRSGHARGVTDDASGKTGTSVYSRWARTKKKLTCSLPIFLGGVASPFAFSLYLSLSVSGAVICGREGKQYKDKGATEQGGKMDGQITLKR